MLIFLLSIFLIRGEILFKKSIHEKVKVINIESNK
jgi:hypothetical protein